MLIRGSWREENRLNEFSSLIVGREGTKKEKRYQK